MLKRLLLIGVLCLCLVAFVTNDATARCRVIGGVLRCTEFCSGTLLKGVGNPDVNDVAVCVGLYIEEVEGRCINKGGNSSEPENHIFNPGISISDTTAVTSADLTDDRGSADVELCWEWEDDIEGPVDAWILNNISEICPNDNWSVGPDWRITVLYVYHSAYQRDKDGNLYSSSAVCRRCEGEFDENDPNGTCGFSCVDVADNFCEQAPRSLDVECLNDVQTKYPPP